MKDNIKLNPRVKLFHVFSGDIQFIVIGSTPEEALKRFYYEAEGTSFYIKAIEFINETDTKFAVSKSGYGKGWPVIVRDLN